MKQNRMTAATVIKKEYGNKPNLMTQSIVRYGWKNSFAYELSHGDFMGKDIYGVSVVAFNQTTEKTERQHDLSQCFYSREQAETYIKNGFKESEA